jgi:hypothetical protein
MYFRRIFHQKFVKKEASKRIQYFGDANEMNIYVWLRWDLGIKATIPKNKGQGNMASKAFCSWAKAVCKATQVNVVLIYAHAPRLITNDQLSFISSNNYDTLTSDIS